MKVVQEFTDQKMHFVDVLINGRLSTKAYCGRNNHKANAWQEPLLFLNGNTCRNCERVQAARLKKETS